MTNHTLPPTIRRLLARVTAYGTLTANLAELATELDPGAAEDFIIRAGAATALTLEILATLKDELAALNRPLHQQQIP